VWHEIEASEQTLKDKDPRIMHRLKKAQERQCARNGIELREGFDLRAQIAAAKIQSGFRKRKADLAKKARTLDDIPEAAESRATMTMQMPQTPGAFSHSSTTALETLSAHPSGETTVAVSTSVDQSEATTSTPALESLVEGSSATQLAAVQEEEELQAHLVPRSGAACDGLDEPGNRRMPASRQRASEGVDSEVRASPENKGSSSPSDPELVPKPTQENIEEPLQKVLIPPVAG
jgi:hypothetical protein